MRSAPGTIGAQPVSGRLRRLLLATGVLLPLAALGDLDYRGVPAAGQLSVRLDGEWRPVWRAGKSLPAGGDRLVQAIQWRDAGHGVRWGEVQFQGRGEAWRTLAVLVRMDPDSLRFELQNGASPGGFEPTWTLEQAPSAAVVAFNAGQFAGAAAWGWVVHDGVEYRPPGRGPLATAIAFDSAGGIRFLPDSHFSDIGRRSLPPGIREAFQSYPVLVQDGAVPAQLSQPGPYLDLVHRDARLALGLLPDGDLVLALTRFDALGDALGSVPFGLTIPETAGIMELLGCSDAVALDGGISAQLLVRDAGSLRTWKGLRRVPLALAGIPRLQ